MSEHLAPAEPARDDTVAVEPMSDGELDRLILISGLATRAGLGLLRNPRCCPLLADEDRRSRRDIQRSLWAGGSRRIVDEGLLADAIVRLPELAAEIAGAAWRQVGS